jgi:dipeptidyl aminopeptidase/acylaminoacyl peptidase
MRHVLPCLLLVLAGPAAAQPPARTHDITPDDYASVALVTGLAVSPDGKQVAYCLATWDEKADTRATDLWVVPTDGKGKPRQLTTDRANARHPKWSADGKAVYVLANRRKDGQKEPPFNGSTQVWQVPADGGDPTAVTKVKESISGFDYAPKADAVFYAVDAEATDEDDFAKLRAKFDKAEYGHGKRKASEVYRSVKGEPAEKLIAEKRYIREFAVTADGKRVAMISAFDDSVLKSEGESRVDVWEAGKVTTPPTDVYRKDAASPWAWLESLAWNPEGTRFAFCAIFDGYPAEVVIGEFAAGKWSTSLLDRPSGHHVRGYGSPLTWRTSKELGYLVERQGAVGIGRYRVGAPPWHSVSTTGDGAVYGFGFIPNDEDGEVARAIAIYGFGNRPGELYRIEPGAHPRQNPITSLNAHTRNWRFPHTEHITWKAPDGSTVGGVLELPPGFKKGDKKLPLVVAIHGGPTTASHADLEFDPHNGRLYFSAHGYAVLCPNYRGSTGYGDKFVTDLLGRENDIEVKDILAGVQHLIAGGIADPGRIGVMGWSNGGYLTNCLISMKDGPVAFKAASSGAGIVDTVAEWGFNDEPAYPRVFKRGLPWETPEIYRKTSPTYQLNKIKTPTLIHVGGNDPRCPPGHSRMLYRALKEYVGVPTQLVTYPGEPHGLTKLSNRKAKMEWDLAWFDKYLKP